jgi:hypothetical protein
MHNGEVAEIVRLEGQATQTEKASSADRWHAAHLIARQLETVTYRTLSQAIKEHGGKGSIGHLERMAKCWKLVGETQYAAFGDNYGAYPNFTTIYQSDEVRGDGDQSAGSGRQREPEQTTGSSLVKAMNAAANELVGTRGYWRQLTDADVRLLQDTLDKIGVLIDRVGG